MAWTYTDDPANVPRDAVRFALGDTDAADQLCSDAQVAFALSQQSSNALLAAALLADRLAARFTRDEAISGDGLSLSGQGRGPAFVRLAKQLRAEAAKAAVPTNASGMRAAGVVVTGIRTSDMATAEADGDRLAPAFIRENPAADEAVLAP